MSYVIENHVAVPEVIQPAWKDFIDVVDTLDVGVGSVLGEKEFRQQVYLLGKRQGKKFLTRKEGEHHIRVWRLEDDTVDGDEALAE